ncbi:hypothetical protein WG622_17180 [Cognatishimia sp. D5M38]|uniref:Uncharacterized protein n=1 Tax=Cognatishimia coralii TaxID=3083254 RepID=A0ABU8QKY2_9RHOB
MKNSLRNDLYRLFAQPPTIFTDYILRDKKNDPQRVSEVREYVENHREMLSQAQHYVIDSETERLFAKILRQLKDDGLEDTFQTIRLPFPIILMESDRDLEAKSICLIAESDNGFFSECFVGLPEGIAPNSSVLSWESATAQVFSSPLGFADNEDAKPQVEQELRINTEFCSMVVALCTLIKYEGMLSLNEQPLYARAERRRAEKAGKNLPNERKIVVKLGDLGRKQLEVMKKSKSNNSRVNKQAHWVTGHFMRTRSGGLSWRTPHIRGIGKPILQHRHVTHDADHFEGDE